jgi:O-antigen ligase
MDSSEAATPAVEAAAAGGPAHGSPLTGRAASVSGERIALAVALVAPWWLPWLAVTVPTFYKEWLFALALGFAGLIAKPPASSGPREPRNPFVLASLAAVAILLLQIMVFDGVWRRATLMIFCAALFAFAIVLGRTMRERSDASLAWIAKCVLVAALGSCLLAAAQLAVPGLPGVLPLSGSRLYGNVAQANHFCDLLWLGCVAAAFLSARGVLSVRTAVVLAVTMLVFSTTSGSRMAWLYAAGLGGLGAIGWSRTREPQARRVAGALMALAVVHVVVVAAVAASGSLAALGLTPAEQRIRVGESAQSDTQRVWFWRVGAEAALDHPLLGVGPGRFPGEGLALAMRIVEVPPAVADAQAHNVFVQLAAECGIPLALAALVALAVWLTRAWREAARRPEAIVAVAMALPILVHANLEHPLGYLYFLGLLGLLVGHVGGNLTGDPAPGAQTLAGKRPAETLRIAAFAVLAAAAIGYVQFAQVERAVRLVAAQMSVGAPPQPTVELGARLAAVPRWSVFGDYAELVSLIAAVPTASTVAALAKDCEHAVAIGPTSPLLARCATILQVAGQPDRASYFANALCRIYPGSTATLIESMTFVARTSPAVEDLRSTCVRRAD